MPSNKDLIENINKIATEKGVEIPNTVGLSNDKLNETLKGLRALEAESTESTESTESSDKSDPEAEEKAQKEAEAKLKADKKQAEKDKKAEEKAAFKAKQDAIPPYRIADGKALTCKKGVLSDGDEIKAEYLPGGKETLDNLVDKGFVIKK